LLVLDEPLAGASTSPARPAPVPSDRRNPRRSLVAASVLVSTRFARRHGASQFVSFASTGISAAKGHAEAVACAIRPSLNCSGHGPLAELGPLYAPPSRSRPRPLGRNGARPWSLTIFYGAPTLGAALLGAACGPVGCFILWRRMAYLGESVAHMGLLGAGLGLLIGVNALIGTAALAVAAALLMARGLRSRHSGGNVLSESSVIWGWRSGSLFWPPWRMCAPICWAYLFGDVLALSAGDLYAVAGASLAASGGHGAAVAAFAAVGGWRRHCRCGRPKQPADSDSLCWSSWRCW